MRKRRRTVVTLTEREVVIDTRVSAGCCRVCGAPLPAPRPATAPDASTEQRAVLPPPMQINGTTSKGTK